MPGMGQHDCMVAHLHRVSKDATGSKRPFRIQQAIKLTPIFPGANNSIVLILVFSEENP